jgi:hypothetical protein
VCLRGAGALRVLGVKRRRPSGAPTCSFGGVYNNLNIANMSWEEFARCREDGVFRGFGQ